MVKWRMIYDGGLKSFRPSLQPTRNSEKSAVGQGSGQEPVSPPHQFKAFLVATHGSMDIGRSIRVCCRLVHGSMSCDQESFTPAAVRFPNQRPLVPGFTQARSKTFQTILVYGLWNPGVQCRIHKGSPIIPILSQINPITRIDTYLFKVHSNIVFLSTPRPP